MKNVLGVLLIGLASGAYGADLAPGDVRADDLTPIGDAVRAAGAPLVWIADGKAALPIVGDTSNYAVRHAAAFLRDVVREMTGVAPAVVKQAEGPAVRIATPSPTDGAFAVSVSEKGVELSGNGPYAAYDFAERVLGVRQYFDPKKGGRIIVKTDGLALPRISWSDRPVYVHRMVYPFSGSQNHPSNAPWVLPMKTGAELKVPHRVHEPKDWYKDPAYDYRTTRPEILERKSDGQRGVSPMLCYSNPKTIETYLERIDEELRGGRKAGILSAAEKAITVSQWDSGLACTCADCLRLRRTDWGDNGTYSPVMWNCFVAKLSDIVRDRYPGYTLSVLPYHNTCMLPPGLAFTNGNVVAWLVTHPGLAMLKEPKLKADEEEKIRGWAKATGGKVVNWHYLCYPQCFTSFPILFGHAAVDHYRAMRDFAHGTFIDSYSEGNGRELSLYVWLRALWNPDFDPEKVYDGFAKRQFGAAARPMRDLMRMQEAGWNRPWKVPLCSNKNIFERSFPRTDVLKMLALADEARRLAKDDAEAAKRVDYYLAPFARFFQESEEYASGGAFTPVEMMKAFTAPKIDGVLDDDCWAKAKEAKMVPGLDKAKKEASVKTEVRIVWTAGDGVTFGVRCHEPAMDKAVRTKPPLAGNETLEFFVDPSGQAEGNFYQIAVDLSGAKHGWVSGKEKWDMPGVKTAVHADADGWSAEVHVPFAAVKDFPEVQIPTTAAGKLFWIGNVVRMRYAGLPKFEIDRLFTRYSKWNKDPAAFGKLVYREW